MIYIATEKITLKYYSVSRNSEFEQIGRISFKLVISSYTLDNCVLPGTFTFYGLKFVIRRKNWNYSYENVLSNHIVQVDA